MGVLRRLFGRLRRESAGRGRDGIDVSALERVLDYHIRDPELFHEALSHRSYLQVTENALSNERLEFLGDAVLNLVAAEYLFHRDTGATEGELTKIRARLVNRKALGVYARDLQLAQIILMSPSASMAPDRGIETIIADAFEAIIGAIYLDGGYGEAERFINRRFHEALDRDALRLEDENFKSRLLEESQGEGLGTPRYVTVNEEGPDHDRTFTVEVIIGRKTYGRGFGKNKKDAEQAAAEQALRRLHAPEEGRSEDRP